MSVAAQAWVPGGEARPELEVAGPDRQRRLTVFFRALLLLPQYVVLYFLSIAAYVVAIVAWFAALILGRLPEGIADFLAGYLRYQTRVQGSSMLLVDRYPPFAWSPVDYVIRVAVEPTRLNRVAVFFRWLLVIPAAILSGIVSLGWSVAAVIVWLVVLIAGRMPQPLFEASAAVLRYQMRLSAYWLMLTPAYPKGLFGDQGTAPEATGTMPSEDASSPATYGQESPEGVPQGEPYAEPESSGLYPTSVPAGGPAVGPLSTPTRPLLVSSGGRSLIVVFLVLGVLSYAGIIAGNVVSAMQEPSSTVARHQLTTAFQQTNRALAPTQQRVQGCGSSPRPARCLHESTRRLADGYHNLSQRVAAISFPDDARAEVASLQRSLHRLAGTLRQLSRAPSAAAFNQILTRDNYPGEIRAVQKAYQTLVTDLQKHR